MNLPTSEPLPPVEQPEPLPAARRRRQSRQVIPDSEDGQAQLLDELGRRVTPGVEFFLFALLSGLIFGAALLFDTPALLLLAALLAPFMGPALGMSLATVAGSANFISRSLGSLLIGGLVYFLSGTLTGILSRALPTSTLYLADLHTRASWADLLLLTIGVILTLVLLERAPQQRPLVSSIAIAYEIFLPLTAAGFSLTSGLNLSWTNGLILFSGGLAWSALVGTLTLVILGLRPLKTLSYILTGSYALVCVLVLLIMLQVFAVPTFQWRQAASAPVLPAAAQPIQTPPPSDGAAASAIEAPQPSGSPSLPTASATVTPTRTLVPSNTPTQTVTPAATPIWARINSREGNGAVIREEPKYEALIIQSALNGTLVQVLPDVTEAGGVTWVKVRTTTGKEGWIVRSLLATATPAPGW